VCECMECFVELVFGFGTFINAMLFIPQAMQVYKNKSAKDLSVATFLGFNIIQFFTILHGYIRKDYVLMFGVVFSFVVSGCVTFLIFLYKRK